MSRLNPAVLLLSLSCFAAAACSSNMLDRGDPEKCLAGEVFKNGKCLPSGCFQDIHCDDGSYCNGEEICQDGRCIGGPPVLCDDGVICTRDECDEDLDVCQHDPDDERCASTEFCDPVRDCVPRFECQTDTDCSGGMVCQDGVCIGQAEEPGPSIDGGMEEEDGGAGDDGGQVDDGGMEDDGDVGDDGGMEEDGGAGDDGGPVVDGGMEEDGGAGVEGSSVNDGGDGVCEPGQTRQCDTGMPGECAMGTDTCESGFWTGCQQTYFAQSEMCDGLDNDCNGEPDDDGVCACLTGCEHDEVCALLDDAVCKHIPGYLNACIELCVGSNACTPSTDGNPKVCVDVPEFALGPACMCETETCPQECRFHRDCYPYGLTFCDGDSKCHGTCEGNFNCPPPYVCAPTKGVCVCDPANIGISCLACDMETDCHLDAFCTYRDDQMRLFKECQYDCTRNAECPQAQYGDKLYCHWGEGSTPNRCACSPEDFCQECLSTDPDPCEISGMNCMVFPTPLPLVAEIITCTTPCQSDELCPAGWYCWNDGILPPGWCIEKGCHCKDIQCGPAGITPMKCRNEFPGFDCISDTDQDPPVELCTKYCSMHSECPPGYWCDLGGSVTDSICRCNIRQSP